jgi:hypothetical protein
MEALVLVTTADTPRALMNGEKLIGLAAATLLVPGHRANQHVAVETLWRWVVKGAKATTGTRVKLEACRVGSRWLTSAEAVGRFVENLTAASIESDGEGEKNEPPVTTPAARTRRAKAASAELDEALK